MNNNICYKIYENDNDNDNENIDIEHLINDIKISINNENKNDHILALQTDYNSNYNVKQLKLIFNYYNIENKKRIQKKQDLINMIIDFELNNENINIVNRRKQLWFYIEQLKQDNYFNKFILI